MSSYTPEVISLPNYFLHSTSQLITAYLAQLRRKRRWTHELFYRTKKHYQGMHKL